MRLNDNTRASLNITAVASVDLTEATLALAIDNIEYPCTWDGAATTSVGKWTRLGHTTSYFVGPTVPAGQVNGATILTYGIHPIELRCTVGTTIIAATLEPITIRVD